MSANNNKPIILGQAPARSGDGRPFTGWSGERLCKMMGIKLEPIYDVVWYDELSSLFDLRNLVQEKQNRAPSGKGDVFPTEVARRRAAQLAMELPNGFVLLMCGRRVSDCFRAVPKSWPLFKPLAINALTPRNELFACWGTVYVVPHPSGISRWWNEPSNVKDAEMFFKTLAEGARALRSKRLHKTSEKP